MTPKRSVAQVVTTAKFNRRGRPKRCDIKRYHVWWFDGERNQPTSGQKCECGSLDWTPRPPLVWA